ncbi:MAG: hypothetical protein OXI96_01445 [Acidimicrobiaceae bacterium]|nr:hypothetical protein [Acidimicrobiaceae bacterium]
MTLAYVARYGSIGHPEAAELCRITPDQASRRLRRMASDSTLEMTGSQRTARYVTPPQEPQESTSP